MVHKNSPKTTSNSIPTLPKNWLALKEVGVENELNYLIVAMRLKNFNYATRGFSHQSYSHMCRSCFMDFCQRNYFRVNGIAALVNIILHFDDNWCDLKNKTTLIRVANLATKSSDWNVIPFLVLITAYCKYSSWHLNGESKVNLSEIPKRNL